MRSSIARRLPFSDDPGMYGRPEIGSRSAVKSSWLPISRLCEAPPMRRPCDWIVPVNFPQLIIRFMYRHQSLGYLFP
jgi:hypothetical protein